MENFQFIIDQKSICRTTPNPFCGSTKFQLTQKYLRTKFWSPGKPSKEVQKCPIFWLWTPPEPQQGPQWPQHGRWVNWAWYRPTWATWTIESSRAMVRIFCLLLRLCVNRVRSKIVNIFIACTSIFLEHFCIAAVHAFQNETHKCSNYHKKLFWTYEGGGYQYNRALLIQNPNLFCVVVGA